MHKSEISRKDFLKKSGLGFAGMAIAPGLLNAMDISALQPVGTDHKKMSKNYALKNVRLETGFTYEGDEVIHTNTGLFSVAISEGKIKSISANTPKDSSAYDAKGLLMLPAFRDMHIHLDKTFYGGGMAGNKVKNSWCKGYDCTGAANYSICLKHPRIMQRN